MKIGSIQLTTKNNKFGIDFQQMHDAGFDNIDFQNFMAINSELYSMSNDEFVNYLKLLKKECKKYNLKINQLHSMWIYPPQEYDQIDKLESTLEYYKKAILGAKIVGCKFVVIHHRFPFNFDDYDNLNKYGENINIDFLKKLLPIAKKNRVYLCLENLPFVNINFCNIKGTLEIINNINDKHLGMCLDTGHYNITDKNINIFDVIKNINKKLYCLHIHDNDGTRDSHLMPGEGNIDWDSFKKGLNFIKFKGAFSYETVSKNPDYVMHLKEEQKLVQFAKSI